MPGFLLWEPGEPEEYLWAYAHELIEGKCQLAASEGNLKREIVYRIFHPDYEPEVVRRQLTLLMPTGFQELIDGWLESDSGPWTDLQRDVVANYFGLNGREKESGPKIAVRVGIEHPHVLDVKSRMTRGKSC